MSGWDDQGSSRRLELWVKIASNNPAAADRIIERVEGACSHLRRHANLGPARPKSVPARAPIINRWLALYKVEPDGVQIVRVVDGARDLDDLSWSPE